MRLTFLKNFTFCLLLLPLSLKAQNSLHVKFDVLTTDDGLSQGMVNSILQDKYGFMWFASNDGLNRYDGKKFTVYKNDPNDNNTIAENFIRFLFEDSKGRIWVATAGSGLDLFDRKTETFTHFKYNAKDPNSISDNSITCIDEDPTGGIWVGTLHGLNRLVIKEKKGIKSDKPVRNTTEFFHRDHTGTFTKIIFDNTHPEREVYARDPDFPLADWRASNFHIDKGGSIWVSAQEKLYRITLLANADYQLQHLPTEKYMPLTKETDGFQKYVQDFIPGPAPEIFYMLFHAGITEVNSLSGNVKILTSSHPNTGVYSFPSVTDKKGILWTSDGTVPAAFNTRTNTWEKISSADKNTGPFLSSISCSYEDKAGNIWLGTKGYGVLRYNPGKNNFNKTESAYISYMSAGKNSVLFLKDPYNELFWEFDRATNTTTVPVPASAISKKQFPLTGLITKSVLHDKDGSYWVGKVGLYHYNPLTKKVTEYWHNYDNVFPLYDDDRNNLWFGNTNGIVHFNKETKASQEFAFPAKTTMGPYDYLQAIHRDKKGILWLGTLGGLYRFDPDKITWKGYKNIAGDLKSLNNNLIFSVCPDPKQPDKYLWIGTKGGGLNRFDQTTGTFTHYTEKEGLSNDVVYGILGDAAGNLWLSTNKGLSQFDTRTRQFKNYNVSDGLQGSEYNRNAFCKTGEGYLYFGGITGFNYFDPAKLTGSTYTPSVWITGINVLNKPVQFQEQNSVLNKPAYLTDSIELKYEQNMISFEFASTDFSAFNNNRFQYQLAGFDKNWIETGVNNTATFTNLDPGTYELRVKGSNSNGVWNEKPTTLTIIILPPWYRTWWFRILVLLLLFSGVYAVHRYRLNKVIQIQKVRDGIAGDLHDEIGSNLSAIAVFSEVASNPNKTNQEVAGLLKKISAYSQSSQDSMSDIVWMIDTKNDRLGAMKVRMYSFATEVLEPKDIRLQFSSEPLLDDVKLAMQQRKAVYLIFKESINNILKYAEATEVVIKISRENEMISLSVADNGKGFIANEQRNKNLKGGNGLGNMKKRAESIKGKLLVKSTEGVGTNVTLLFSA